MTGAPLYTVNFLNFHFPIVPCGPSFPLLGNRAVDCKMSLADAMPLANIMVREG